MNQVNQTQARKLARSAKQSDSRAEVLAYRRAKRQARKVRAHA